MLLFRSMMLYLKNMDMMLARCLTTEPMWQRIKRQEGALLAIVATSLFFSGHSLLHIMGVLGLSLLTISTLYFFNDLTDCVADKDNPRKDSFYVSTLNTHNKTLWVALGCQKLLALSIAFSVYGVEQTGVVAGIFAINAMYSLKIKRVPLLDVIWVGFWGAGICALAGIAQPWESFALVASMTAISHIYQVRIDATADQAHNVQTSAVVSLTMTEIQIGVLCIILAGLIAQSTAPLLAVTAIVPWFLGKYLNSALAWVLARYYFGIIWLCHLESTYGHLATF